MKNIRKLIESVFFEAPVWDETSKTMADELGDVYKKRGEFYTLLSKEKKGDLIWIWYIREASDSIVIDMVQDNRHMGEFIFYTDTFSGQKCLKVESVILHPSLHGKGIALNAYLTVIEKYKLPMMSDASLTGEKGAKGSFHVWQRLSKNVPFSYLWSPKGGFVPVKEFTRSMMTKSDTRFVVSHTELGEKKLTEMPKVTDAWKVLGEPTKDNIEQLQWTWQRLKLDKPIIQVEDGDYTFQVWFTTGKKYGDKLTCIITYESEPIGYLSATVETIDEGNLEGLTLGLINQTMILDEHQGQGLGREMYEMIFNLDMLNGIASDTSLTGEDRNSGSFKVWKWLSNNHLFYIWDTGTDEATESESLTDSYEGDEGELFLILKEPIDSLNEDFGLDRFEITEDAALDPNVRKENIRIGLAVYDKNGYRVLNDDGNNKIKELLDDINPQGKVSRGQSFNPIVKKTPYGMGVTIPVRGQGAGGSVPFASLVLYATHDSEDIKRAVEKIMKVDSVPIEHRYGLAKLKDSGIVKE